MHIALQGHSYSIIFFIALSIIQHSKVNLSASCKSFRTVAQPQRHILLFPSRQHRKRRISGIVLNIQFYSTQDLPFQHRQHFLFHKYMRFNYVHT